MARFTVHLWFTPDEEGSDTGTISMRCTRIEEALRGKGKIHEHNEIEVCSWACPEIDGLTVYLPGTERDADNNIATIPGTRTLYTSYIAAGGEVIEGDPEEPASAPEAVEQVKDTTTSADSPKARWTATFPILAAPEPAEERRKYSVHIGDDNHDINIGVNLTRAELAELVADLIRKG